MQLPPGDYQVEITLAGYETVRAPVRIASSNVTLPASLKKIEQPAAYRLTVQPDPPTAQVRLVDSSTAYQPGVPLTPGRYTVEVTQSGYEPRPARRGLSSAAGGAGRDAARTVRRILRRAVRGSHFSLG